MRAGLLFAVAVPVALASPLGAQVVAPTLTGETGLFELTNAETLQQGRFSLGLYYSQSDRTAGPSALFRGGADDPLRYGTGKVGVTVGFGLTSNWELTLSAGQRYYTADERDWAGVINGRERRGGIKHNETDKIRIGSKVVLNQKDPLKIALFGGFTIPTQVNSDPGALSTNRSDWDFGLSGSVGIMTVQASYLNTSDFNDSIGIHDVPNEFKWGLGFAVPIIPKTLRGIVELNRIHYDGGGPKPDDFSEALVGARFGGGGLAVGAALRANIDRWTKYGSRPNNLGGIVQISYLTPMGSDDRPKVAGAAEEPSPIAPAQPPQRPAPTTPTPTSEAPPPTKGETSTTDEILFDSAKSRLTNIAKAILDGVALRLKNNLSATCTVVAYTDPKEKGGDHNTLSTARAEAAKDYLMKRHGIDASRIKMEAKGDLDSGSDATRNRRAVVTVTFP